MIDLATKRRIRKEGRKEEIKEKSDVPSKVDGWVARELILFIENNDRLYESMVKPLARNYVRKLKRGTFQESLAVKDILAGISAAKDTRISFFSSHKKALTFSLTSRFSLLPFAADQKRYCTEDF